MKSVRQLLKQYLPGHIRAAVQDIRRNIMKAPLVEDANLHAYKAIVDNITKPRLSLVIPTVAADVAFGGVITGLDFFLEVGRLGGADLRVILDDLTDNPDLSILNKRAIAYGIDPKLIEVVARREAAPTISIRKYDVFITFNWWTTLNIRPITAYQARLFNIERRPYIYLIQDYEPHFYPFSSSHMMAMHALDSDAPYWGVFNTEELLRYCVLQGHLPQKSFVFNPKISESLRPFLNHGVVKKQKRILIYGRPAIPRNCFPAICRGLNAWIDNDSTHSDWEIVSAGTHHKPVALSKGRKLRSVGKLSLEEYARLLQTSAVGISLMSSPHPSYPPLEMAHFGLLTITNSYIQKNLAFAHDNIISIDNISEQTLAKSLEQACSEFANTPGIGFLGRSNVPWFLREETFECLRDVVSELRLKLWTDD